MCNLEFTLLDFGEVHAMISTARGGRNAWPYATKSACFRGLLENA